MLTRVPVGWARGSRAGRSLKGPPAGHLVPPRAREPRWAPSLLPVVQRAGGHMSAICLCLSRAKAGWALDAQQGAQPESKPWLRASPGTSLPSVGRGALVPLLAVWAKGAEHRRPGVGRVCGCWRHCAPARPGRPQQDRPAAPRCCGRAGRRLLLPVGSAPRERVPGTSDGACSPVSSDTPGLPGGAGPGCERVPWATPGPGLRTAVFQPPPPRGWRFRSPSLWP